MNQENSESPVSSQIQAVLDLFEGELAALKFPDVDSEVLNEAAEAVKKHAEALARAEQVVQGARASLQECQDQLVHKCQRAIAYARIYAEDNSELLRRIDGISVPKNGRPVRALPVTTVAAESRPPARRGRRGSPQSGPLFIDQGQEPGHTDESQDTERSEEPALFMPTPQAA